MNAELIIQKLIGGETVLVTDAAGARFEERRAPTTTALQAARTIQKLLELHNANQRVINQLQRDNEGLHEQIKLLQSTGMCKPASTGTSDEYSSNTGSQSASS